uniref:HTH CENPB-type domain-containing protein n=1 Tax=Cacopsylla melanoneura TaxID=428564 RepID=A0A8D8VHG1_9HEMI
MPPSPPAESPIMAPRKKWKKEDMVNAVRAMRLRQMGSFKASKVFNVPQTTLERYAKRMSVDEDAVVHTKTGRKPYLSAELEQELADQCSLLERKSTKDVKRLAFQLARANNVHMGFSAGDKWFNNFMKRHPDLSVRRPEGLSKARASVDTSQQDKIPVKASKIP